MNIANYFKLLEEHDWYYQWSDDPRVWQSGEKNRKRLESLRNESETHAKLFADFQKHYFSGDAWNSTVQAKPKLEDYIEGLKILYGDRVEDLRDALYNSKAQSPEDLKKELENGFKAILKKLEK